MPETATNAPKGLLTRVVDWIASRLHAGGDITALSRGDISEMAHDLGLCEADLRGALAGGPDNTALMDAMMRARGLDPIAIEHLMPAVMRDLELTCTRCRETRRCRRELAAGTAAAHGDAFCGNAETLAALLEEADTV